jgi:hypothetical protein
MVVYAFYMEEQQQIRRRNLQLVFRIYVVVVVFLSVGLIWGFITPDFANNILHARQGYLFSQVPDFGQLMRDLTTDYLIFAIIVGALGAIISIGTRDVFEVLALFFTGMLPRERKYWGVIFEQDTGKPVAFVPVRLFMYEEGQGKLVAQTVTDTDGRYRLHVENPRDKRYTIEIHYPGYEPVVTDVQQYLVIGNYELISDIPLIKSKSAARKLQTWFYYHRSKLFNYLFLSIYVIYIVFWLLAIVMTINSPIFINLLFNLPMMTITLIWNTQVVGARFKPVIGKVVDLDTKQPIPSALVNVYTNQAETITAMTDNTGIVKLNMPSGIYRTLVSANNYLMLGGDTQGLKIVKVGKDGYIDKDVLLKKKTNMQTPSSGSSLLNPFQ